MNLFCLIHSRLNYDQSHGAGTPTQPTTNWKSRKVHRSPTHNCHSIYMDWLEPLRSEHSSQPSANCAKNSKHVVYRTTRLAFHSSFGNNMSHCESSWDSFYWPYLPQHSFSLGLCYCPYGDRHWYASTPLPPSFNWLPLCSIWTSNCRRYRLWLWSWALACRYTQRCT